MTHHLSKDFRLFGPGESSVRDPAWHQPLIRVGSRSLHLSHHRLLLLLLRGNNMKVWPTARIQHSRDRKYKCPKRPQVYCSFRFFIAPAKWSTDLFSCTDPFLAAPEDQEGLDTVLLQIRVPLASKSWLHLIVSIKILQSGLSDVDPPTETKRPLYEKLCVCVCSISYSCIFIYSPTFELIMKIISSSMCVNAFLSPCFAPRFHMIGQCDIVWPHVKLPLPETQHAAVHTPAVNANAHVNVDPRHLTNQSANKQSRRSVSFSTTGSNLKCKKQGTK